MRVANNSRVEKRVKERATPSRELKSSAKKIGQLYPVLLDRHGNIIDGRHRLNANKNWKRLKLNCISTEEDLLVARLVSNTIRRKVTKKEKTEALRQLGHLYIEQGIKPGEIANKIAEKTGMSYRWVTKYLPNQFKDESHVKRAKLAARCAAGNKNIMIDPPPGLLSIKFYSNADLVSVVISKSFYKRINNVAKRLKTSPNKLIYNALLLSPSTMKKFLVNKNTFTIAISGYCSHFLAATVSTRYSSPIGALLYPALLAYDLDNNMEPVTSELVSSFKMSKDSKALTFRIRKDVTWTDGRPLTSNDVKFTLEELTSKLHPHGVRFLKSLDYVETPNDYTAIIRLKKPYGMLPYFFHWRYCTIVPQHIWAPYVGKLSACPEFSFPRTTAGPWVLKEHIKKRRMVFEKNLSYFKNDEGFSIDRLVLKIIPDLAEQIAALERGEVDTLMPVVFPGMRVSKFSKDPSFTIPTFESELRVVMMYLVFNLRNPFLLNKKVRHALAYSIDRHSIVNRIFGKYAKVCHSPMPEGPMWDEYRKNIFNYEYSPEKANILLDEAGYPKIANGMRGIKLRYLTNTSEEHIKTAEEIASYWRAVGVEAEIVPVEESIEAESIFRNPNFDCANIDYGEAPDWAIEGRKYKTDSIGKPSENAAGYSNPTIDKLFNTVLYESKRNKRKQLFWRIQEILVEDLPYIWLYQWNPPQVFTGKPRSSIPDWKKHEVSSIVNS
jgi:peptide/nickel transport system substrate-binding protein